MPDRGVRVLGLVLLAGIAVYAVEVTVLRHILPGARVREREPAGQTSLDAEDDARVLRHAFAPSVVEPAKDGDSLSVDEDHAVGGGDDLESGRSDPVESRVAAPAARNQSLVLSHSGPTSSSESRTADSDGLDGRTDGQEPAEVQPESWPPETSPQPTPTPGPSPVVSLLPRNLRIPEIGQDAVVVVFGTGLEECTYLSIRLEFDAAVLAPRAVSERVLGTRSSSGWRFEWHPRTSHGDPPYAGLDATWAQAFSLPEGLGGDTLCVVSFHTLGRGFGRLHFEEVVALDLYHQPLACEHTDCVVEVARF